MGERTQRLHDRPTRDLVADWDIKVPDEELAIVKARAKKAGLSLAAYIKAECNGPTERSVPFVKFALSGSDETVAAECAEFLKRIDVLEYVEMPTALVVSVLEELVETDPTLSQMNYADWEVLKTVRDVWQTQHNKTRRRS